MRRGGPSGKAEEILRSYHYLRLIRVLAESQEPCTKYAIHLRTGLSFKQISEILDILMRYGWVGEHDYQPRKYSLIRSHEGVQLLLTLLEKLNYL
ncbi:MAG: hypothetical protein QW756_02655 [Nitrososphaerota archaeon]